MADYVLFVDKKPFGIFEAKGTNKAINQPLLRNNPSSPLLGKGSRYRTTNMH
jgi:type I site-specific restriction endonuclease